MGCEIKFTRQSVKNISHERFSKQLYCSDMCKRKHQKKLRERICINCNKTHYVKCRDYIGNFCKPECKKEFSEKNKLSIGKYNLYKKNCTICKKKYLATGKGQQTCGSDDCKFMRNRSHAVIKRYLKNKHLMKFIIKRLNNYKQRAKKIGIDYYLSAEYLYDIFPKDFLCPIRKIKMNINSNIQVQKNSASLDRINNNKGYVVGNVKWISSWANTMKSNITIDELRNMLNYYVNHEALQRLSDTDNKI
jgi:hypothetical protein